ncbi:MAG: carbohydrate esterase family 4 protein [Linnemannia elongata]|nr:MAG: carbohydrate esterase family 4 protein [Linnemannia elongata]
MSCIISLATIATFLLLAASPFTNTPITANALAVIEKCTVPNTVALTFNGGPYQYTKDIVDALKAANARATFFVNGNNYVCIYNTDESFRLKYAYEHGHQIASLTWSHQDLTTLSYDQIHSEMERVEQAISKITGANPAFMRPPYGSHNDLVLQVAQQRGQQVVAWDFDSGDDFGATVGEQKASFDKTIDRHPNNVLALMYEVYETTAHQTLPYAITKIQAAGYRLVTVAECLGEEPYTRVGAPAVRDSTWHC